MESLVFLIWILCGVLAAAFGSQKGTGCMSAIIGFLLGPIGLIVVILDKGNRINCPYCRQLIDKKAVICPFCRSSLVSPPTNSVHQEYYDDLSQLQSGSAESTPYIENHTASTCVYHNDPPKQVSVLLAIGILIMPYIFVWVLLKKGYTDIARVVGFAYLLIFIIITVSTYNNNKISDNDNGNTRLLRKDTEIYGLV